jgi:hypothetical protein
MSSNQTCDANIAHTTISYDPYQTQAKLTHAKASAQSPRPANPTSPRRTNNMNDHQTPTPAPREHDSTPPPLPQHPKHNATHVALLRTISAVRRHRATYRMAARSQPSGAAQHPTGTQRDTPSNRHRTPNSWNTSRTGPSVCARRPDLPRIMASARPTP